MHGQENQLRAIMAGDYLPVAFVGSGISRNYVDWTDFVLKLAEHFGNTSGVKALQSAPDGTLDLESMLLIADDSLEGQSVTEKPQFVSDLFSRPGKAPSVFDAIVRAPFAFYITTNYDGNIEEAYRRVRGEDLPVVSPDSIEQALTFMRSGNAFVLKVHGCARAGRSFVIGHEDYRSMIYDNRHLRYVLASILATRPIVFIGYGHRDPHITRYLDYERTVLPSGGMQRFSFLREGEENLALRAHLRRMNVTSVRVKEWPELETILEQCAFLRMRDRYQRGRQEFHGEFLRFVGEARIECAWGALMHAQASSDLGHGEDVQKVWETVKENKAVRRQIEASAPLELALRVIAGQMLKRSGSGSEAREEFDRAEQLARDSDGILRPLRAMALRYAGIFRLWPPDREEQDIDGARELFEEAATQLGEDFPEEMLDVEKWQAVLSGEIEGGLVAARKLIRIAEKAEELGYRKNAAWCRYSAVDQYLRAGQTPAVTDEQFKHLHQARESFEELQHPRGLGASHYLLAVAKNETADDHDMDEVASHLASAQAMAVICGDRRLEVKCKKFAERFDSS